MQNARGAGSAGDVTETIESVLRTIEASIASRLRPAIARRPLQTLSQAAAAGFVLGILVPVRLQALALQPLVALGVRKLLATPGPHGRVPAPIGHTRPRSHAPAAGGASATPAPIDTGTLTP